MNIDPKEIRRLWILKLIIDHGSIKQAALHANITSSAVSQALSGLEQSLDRRLLIKQEDGYIPTSYCSELLLAAEPALSALSHLHDFINPEPQKIPQFKSLVLGTTPSLAIDILPELSKKFLKKFPGIRIQLKTGGSAALSHAVKKGDLQIALVADNDQTEGLSIVPVATERMGFYCSSNPEISKQGWDLVEKLGVAAFPPDHEGYAPYFRKLFRMFGPKWRPSLTSESYEALRAVAALGVMVSVLSTRVAAVSKGDIVEITPPGSPGDPLTGAYQISLVTDKSLENLQIDFLAKELRKILEA